MRRIGSKSPFTIEITDDTLPAMDLLPEIRRLRAEVNELQTKLGSVGGIRLWAVLAVVISWDLNHSFWWALWHGICGPFYLLYWALFL